MNSRPMSNIDKRALREELSNPAIGSNAHLRKLALVLLDELEAKDRRLNEILKPDVLLPVIDDMDEDNLRHVIKTVCENYSLLHAKWASAGNRAKAAEKRIAELEAREVKLPERYEVDMCPTPSPDGEWYSREDVLSALVSAGLKVAAAGKGE